MTSIKNGRLLFKELCTSGRIFYYVIDISQLLLDLSNVYSNQRNNFKDIAFLHKRQIPAIS